MFTTPTVEKPLISVSARLHDVNLKPTFVCARPTEAGQTYLLVKT